MSNTIFLPVLIGMSSIAMCLTAMGLTSMVSAVMGSVAMLTESTIARRQHWTAMMGSAAMRGRVGSDEGFDTDERVDSDEALTAMRNGS